MKRLMIATMLFAAAGCGASTNNSGNNDGNHGAPSASAVANVTTGIAPLDVQFTGVAAGGTGTLTYSWDFGDGETASEQSPAHTFAATGTFVATFTATDAASHTGSATVTVQVGSASAPTITASADHTTGLAPLAVAFTGNVVGGDAPVNVSWNFGDGQQSSGASASHTYQNPGSYGAVVTATDANGDAASATVLVQVGTNAKPVVAINATPTQGAAPLAVSFTANAVGGDAPLTYAWAFGDAATGTGGTASHTYQSNGSYDAKVTVTDANGDAATATVTIVVNNSTGSTQPDLQLANFDSYTSGLSDPYEPNDAAAYYLGDYGSGNAVYTVNDAYIDAVDVTYTVDVVNFGAAINAPFDVDFYKDSTTEPAADVYGDQYQTVSNLAANGSQRLYYTVTTPTPNAMTTAWARVDTFDEVAEMDETNNMTSGLDVTPDGDQDWYSVYETSGENLQVTLNNLPGDFDVFLYDENGTQVASSENAGTTAESISYTTSGNQLYFVEITGYGGNFSSSQPYHLTVTVP
jgi:PKD repeat protein